MNKSTFFIICIFFLFSCNTGINKEEKRLAIYNEALSTFSPDYIRHFPNDLTHLNKRELFVYYPKSTKYNKKAGLILNSWVDSIFFIKTLSALKSSNLPRYSILSDSLIFIGDTNEYYSIQGGIPLPSFSDIHDQFGLNNIRLNNREKVYIIETKKGEFLEKENLVEDLFLPQKWQHGLSRGIAIDTIEYRIVYWLVMW